MDAIELTNTLVFYVNGKKNEMKLQIEDGNVNPEWTLLQYLRNKLRLCGTKLGCGEGGCGACTVMVSKYNRITDEEVHIPVNACLAPVCSMHGLAVTTVEGIGSTKTKLHPVQERIAKSHGTQCGFCTPGIVMSMYVLLRNNPKPDMSNLEEAFQGNLCRCTGYRSIIEGYKTFTEQWEIIQNGHNYDSNTNTCGLGKNCCKVQSDSIGYQSVTNCNNINNGLTNGDHNNSSLLTNGFAEGHHEDATNNGFTNSRNSDIPHLSNGHNDETSSSDSLFNSKKFASHDPTQELIYPPELKVSDKYDKQFMIIAGKNITWYRPVKLQQILDLKHKHPNSKMIAGNSEIGVEVKFKNMLFPILIQSSQVEELVNISVTQQGVRVGASTTLANVNIFLKQQIESLPEEKTRLFQTIVNMLPYFAGKQIRSVGTMGGNIITGSPISDMIPILIAGRVELEISNKDKSRRVILDPNFYKAYRTPILLDNEILVAINIPFTEENQYCYAHKQARRREDDIAIVTFAINVSFEKKSNIIVDIVLAFGGMSFKTVIAPRTQEKLIGLPWNRNTLELAYSYLLEDLPLNDWAPGGNIQYRRSLTLSLFFKAFLLITTKLQNYVPDVQLNRRELSGISGFATPEYRSSQYFNAASKNSGALQQPLVHTSAFKQVTHHFSRKLMTLKNSSDEFLGNSEGVEMRISNLMNSDLSPAEATGEAIYCDDIPKFENELYMAFVLSTESHATIVSIDPTKALAEEGVHGFFSAKDLHKGHSMIGSVVLDEKVFFTDEVTSQGQIIAAIAADTQCIAQRAAANVKVVYEQLQPVIITIEEAIEQESYFKNPHRTVIQGDISLAFKQAAHVIEGECRISGQEHFYMETQCVIAVPKGEDSEMDIYSSTQNPTELSKLIAEVLGVPQNRIICKVKRLGGGFGGKESKSVIVGAPAAIAAAKLGRPVRIMLDRNEDMMMTGGRHPFLMKYKVGCDHEGRILGCEMKIYCNAGYSTDLSQSLMDRTLGHIENAYKIPTVHLTAYLCKTNLPSNTAFRGFGGPQAMYAAECMIHHIAEHLNKDVTILMELNLYTEGDFTYYNQQLNNCTIRQCWDECINLSDYYYRRKQVEKYNRLNIYKKRGISVIPTKYGIAFTVPFLNQGGALVLVYTDGSVLLSHGGVEMGQGLHTKMLQVASRCLEIPMDRIHISETSTDKVPNTSPTAASTGSDLNGMAIMEACKIIKERIQPYKNAKPNGKWDDWVRDAYYDRVSLAATGFYKTPDLGYNWNTGEGNMYNYFTYGVACSEVEIDTLTGDHQVLRTDIVMDVGASLNPAIDIGQIEGAFMQGYGLFVLEEMLYSPSGTIFTRGPGTYKIPGFSDIPAEFNVSLLKGSSNPRAVYSSKAVGEPPLFLASSIFFAILHAIKAARIENGITSSFKIDSPATVAKIRMACQDNITAKLGDPKSTSSKPWNIIV